jgi:signal transduction histidine kinase/CheY-like chemotaxis protein
VDAAGCCTYVTAHGAHLLGYTVGSLIGASLHATIHPPLADGRPVSPAECALCQALQTREPQRAIKASFRHANGHALPVSYSIVPIISKSEINGGAVIAFSDDSERLRAEQEVLRLKAEIKYAERRQTEFIAVLSHELRNPLAPLRSALQVMRKRGAGDESTTQLRDMMERQLGQLAHLVNDLMDIARLTSGKVALKKERVSLQEILSGAIEASAAVMVASTNPLTVDMPREPLLLHADATRLTQVFTNLLNNASQYSDAGDPITLRVVNDGERVQVHIVDRGIGIGPEALEQIFEMFTSGRHADGTRAGLGIGLNLARRLVELHNGDLSAQSDGHGHGSDFVVTLPLAEPTTPNLTKSAPASGQGVQQRVRALIVDDNVDAAESLSLLLELEGHKTSIANNGPEALGKVSEFKPDIVLLDIGLPGMNGYDVARAIRDLPGAERLPLLVAITGWGSEEDRRRSASAGFDEHLTKPVDISMIELLLTTLRSRAVPGNQDLPRADAASPKARQERS